MSEKEDYTICFLCEKNFEEEDKVVEFFGGYTHFSCFDKQMKENKKKKEGLIK